MALIHQGSWDTLQAIDIADISNGDTAQIYYNSRPRTFTFDSSSTEAEKNTRPGPYYLRPHDYSTTGVWIETIGNDYDVINASQLIGSKLLSTNWGTSTGSEYDLDAGTIRLGGSSSPAFSVTAAGVLTATGATITGTITAPAGTIGGWTLSSTEMHNTNIWLDAADKQIAIKSQTFGSDGIQLEYNSGNPRVYIGDGSNSYFNFDGTKITWKATNSELDSSGNLICTGGTIGGFTISSTEGLYAGTGATRVQMKPGVGIWTGATAQADALNFLKVDGSGWFADGNISWTTAGLLTATFDDGGTITLDAGADIILTGSDTDPAKIEFHAPTLNKSIELYIDSTLGYFYISPTTAYTTNLTINKFNDISVIAKNQIEMSAVYSSPNYSSFIKIYSSDYSLSSGLNEGSYMLFSHKYNGLTREIYFTYNSGKTAFTPGISNKIDLGLSGYEWRNLYISGGFNIKELSADPSSPSEGKSVLWQSDGTGSGDDGDILMKITAGGTTKTITLIDFSAA